MEDQSVQLKKFYIDLRSDWKHWALLQIKQAMITGKNNLAVCRLHSKMYKRAKHLFNFWKPIPLSDVPYYDRYTNIIITNTRSREIIDYVRSLGLQWFIDVDYDDNLLSGQVLKLYITCYYTPDVLPPIEIISQSPQPIDPQEAREV